MDSVWHKHDYNTKGEYMAVKTDSTCMAMYVTVVLIFYSLIHNI